MALAQKHERGIGALGARWGLQSEKAFRDALAVGILEKNFGVQVLNVNEFDEQGVDLGQPDQVELDVIIQNGLLLICELKSSIDKAGMYISRSEGEVLRAAPSAHRQAVDRDFADDRRTGTQGGGAVGDRTCGDSTEVEAL